MQILPVLDILNGRTVHAVAGRRQNYQPVRSVLADSCDPSVLLRAFESLGLRECYLADLDAIEGRAANRCVLAELTRGPLRLHVDAGVRNCADAEALFDLDVQQVIVALETLPGPDAARELIEQFGCRLTVSLDLHGGHVRSPWVPWVTAGAQQTAEDLISIGFRSMIVLDVATVGSSKGPAVVDLCRQIRQTAPGIQLCTGGGIRNLTDLNRLSTAGLDAALVATALHEGTLTADDVMTFVQSNRSR